MKDQEVGNLLANKRNIHLICYNRNLHLIHLICLIHYYLSFLRKQNLILLACTSKKNADKNTWEQITVISWAWEDKNIYLTKENTLNS